MGGDLAGLAAEVTPYVTAAVSAYGGAVLAKTQDEAAEAAVGVGRRLVQRIFGVRAEPAELPEVLADVVDDPDDADGVAALRKAIGKALSADAALASEVRGLVAEARAAGVVVTASGERSVATHINTGVIVTGDDASVQR